MRKEGGRRGRDGGKIKWTLSEVNTRPMSRGQNQLIGKFKMAAGDMISTRGQVMENTYIPLGIKREFIYLFILLLNTILI